MIYKSVTEMSSFELNVFISNLHDKIYEHLSEPINMIGLLPRLTEIDVLKPKIEDGVRLRPFYVVETYRLLGLPIFRNRLFSVIRLTKPNEELEINIFSKPGIEVIFNYRLRQFNDGTTQLTQTVQFVKVNKLLAVFVEDLAKHAQRTILSNLKVRLENR